MLIREFRKLNVGDHVYCSFGKSYRRATVKVVYPKHILADAGLARSGYRLDRRAAAPSIDLHPRKPWLGFVEATDGDEYNVGREYFVESFDESGNPFKSTGLVGSLRWAFDRVRHYKKAGAFACIITEHAAASVRLR